MLSIRVSQALQLLLTSLPYMVPSQQIAGACVVCVDDKTSTNQDRGCDPPINNDYAPTICKVKDAGTKIMVRLKPVKSVF